MELNELFNDNNFKIALYLKCSQLQRILPSLSDDHIKIACCHTWEKEMPSSLNQVINELMNLSADQVVAILSCEAVVQGAAMSIDEFDGLFKEEHYEKA